MSHQYYNPAKTRLQRSELAVPGSSPKMFEKALNSNADYIFLDLEDAVSPNDKLSARENIIKALNEINWRAKGKTISVRINSLDTHYMYRDVVDIMEQVGDKVDTILVPKVGTSSDVYMVDCLLTQIENNKKLKSKVGIECLIETALGMSNIKEIAKSSNRLEALHFGVADYAASLRARTVVIGGLNPDYPGDQWHHGLSQLVMTCRAYGLRAIDGPFGDFKDPDAYVASAKRAAAIGIEGKWAIHPSQIDLANKVFSPPVAEVNRAKKILEELDKKSLVRILQEPKNSLLKQYKKLFEFENVKLTFKDEAVSEIAKKAINKKTGARGLRSIIEALLLKTMFKLPAMDDIEEVLVNESVVKNNSEPLIIHSRSKKTSAA